MKQPNQLLVRHKINQLRNTPGMQKDLKQYTRYTKKHQHIVSLGKVIVLYLLVIAILFGFKIMVNTTPGARLLIYIAGFCSVAIFLIVLPIFTFTKIMQKKQLHKIKDILSSHHLEKYIKLLFQR